MDDAERLVGVLTRDDLIAALRKYGPDVPVIKIMRSDLPAVSPQDPFENAFRAMQESASPALPVLDRHGRFIGLITPENIDELMLVQSLRPRNGQPTWREAPAVG